MKWLNQKFKKYSMLGAVLFIIFCTTSAAGIHVSGVKYMGDISEGETVIHQMTIDIGDNAPATNISAEVLGFGQTYEKKYFGLNSSKDISPYSARNAINLDKTSFHIDPNEKVSINATIKIPKNAGSGGRYALINIYTEPTEGQVGISTAVLIPIMLTISGTELIETGEITNLSVSGVTVGQPLVVTTTLKNTGNHHYYRSWNEITVKNENGNMVAKVSTEPSIYAIIPTNSVNFDAKIERFLPVGTYTIHSKIMLEDGTVLDEESTTFEVETEYIPPFKEVSMSISPGKAAVLATDNGRCVVSFPQGSVVSGATITLKPGNLEKLPEAPPGYEMGVTCLYLGGLQGLLAKDAKLTVQYLEEDLKAAKGIPSRLNLAYWDDGLRQWVPVPTELDKENMTLSAYTNRLGSWVVLAGDPVTDVKGGGSSIEKSKMSSPLGGVLPAVTLLVAWGLCLIWRRKQV